MVIAVPFLITLTTGILLATRGFFPWVQPAYPPLKSHLQIDFDRILGVAKSVPEAQIKNWEDVTQIDIRPHTGNIRVRSKNMWEIQIDGATGAIANSGIRRVSWLVSLHEGAQFGPAVRYGIFLPSALGVLFLLFSGIVMAFQPLLKNSKVRK